MNQMDTQLQSMFKLFEDISTLENRTVLSPDLTKYSTDYLELITGIVKRAGAIQNYIIDALDPDHTNTVGTTKRDGTVFTTPANRFQSVNSNSFFDSDGVNVCRAHIRMEYGKYEY